MKQLNHYYIFNWIEINLCSPLQKIGFKTRTSESGYIVHFGITFKQILISLHPVVCIEVSFCETRFIIPIILLHSNRRIGSEFADLSTDAHNNRVSK